MLKTARFRLAVAVGWLLLLVLAGAWRVEAQGASDFASGGTSMSVRQTGRVRAPELTGGRGWLNTDKPLSIAGLRGKVVLLDFWTYGCINCIHIIPDLQRLEAKYSKQLVVIGVHSAKFDNEKETDNIRRIILRYGIEHPVVNDADFSIWQSYAVRAWPTRVLVDPAGYVIGKVEGEGNYEGLDRVIGETAEEFRKRGELNEQPLKLALERARTADLPLAFPGKVLADARTGRLYIADSNHNRIVVAKLDGTLLDIIGTGERGSLDGAYDAATFNRPQGLALDVDRVFGGESLYVADTENHLVRRVDLRARTVQTVAGNGQQARGGADSGGAIAPAIDAALSSPWDLQLAQGKLLIAMAGTHQIWAYGLPNSVGVFAGSGLEARHDASLDEAAFAQPSGLATDGQTLYVADSESNIIRAVSLAEGGQVRTLAGGDLFDFGDVDGRGDEVRLQHPLGLALYEGKLLIADTYNHKIKLLDPQTRTVKSFAGTGRPGQADGAAASFYEPGGLSVAADKLYVADTNNHAIRVVDLKTRQTSTLMLRGLRPPDVKTASGSEDDAASAPNTEETRLAPQRLRAGAASTLSVEVALPAGYHLNNAAPQRYRLTIEPSNGAQAATVENASAPAASKAATTAKDVAGTKDAPPAKDAATPAFELARTSKDLTLPLRLPLRALDAGKADLRLRLTLYYCREDNTGVCRIKTLDWRLPLEVVPEPAAPNDLKLSARITLEP